MDFDDLLLYTYILLKEHPEVCGRYADIFDFVLVDEYQDTNYAQHCIVWELTQKKQQVCVVGDDAQSIYSFRGANIDTFLISRRNITMRSCLSWSRTTVLQRLSFRLPTV